MFNGKQDFSPEVNSDFVSCMVPTSDIHTIPQNKVLLKINICHPSNNVHQINKMTAMIHVCAIYTQTCKSKDSKQSIKNNIYYKNISNFPNIRNEDSKPKHMKEIEAPPEAKQHN